MDEAQGQRPGGTRAALPWRDAWERAAFGPGGFYDRPDGAPAGHFSTSVSRSGAMAEVVVRLLAGIDDALGRPDRLSLVDVGAGDGQLLAAVAAHPFARRGGPRGWSSRLDLVGVDVRDRPAGLTTHAGWVRGRAPLAVPGGVVGLVWAHELLDDVPCAVVAASDDHEVHAVLVDESGDERLGGPPGQDELGWLARWWPLDAAAPGDRAEVGLARDDVWSGLCARLAAGAAVAVDYSHTRAHRAARRWPRGTLVGYARGRAVAPVPDGSCNLTAHVALDACAASGAQPGDEVVLTTQAAAVARFVRGRADQHARPSTGTGLDRLRAVALASSLAALRDPVGPGAFGWLELRRGLAPDVTR